MMPWDDERLDAVEREAQACTSDDACTSDVLALVAEVRRLREALQHASGQLGVLSTVLSGSNRPTHATRAWEWSKQARAAAEGAMSAPRED